MLCDKVLASYVWLQLTGLWGEGGGLNTEEVCGVHDNVVVFGVVIRCL